MSSTTGLQRRRATGGAGTFDLEEDSGASFVGKAQRERPIEKPHVESSSGLESRTTIQNESGHRVAYDPRDLDESDESHSLPRLTLMEELYLLGLKDRQGYLSFWNEHMSYVLRGSILMELALRGRLRVAKTQDNRLAEPADRVLEVCSTKHTGDALLDEAIRVIKSNAPASIAEWIDLLNGETWSVSKLSMQLKQVRERIAKGLAEKGVLRTEKKSFLLFDMPTHPLADKAQKEAVLRRIYALLTSKSQSVHPDEFYKEEASSVRLRVTRTLCMVCCAFCANVLENTLTHLPAHLSGEVFDRASALVTTYGQWPMAPDTPGGGIPGNGEYRSIANSSTNTIRLFSRTKKTIKIGVGDAELVKVLRKEMQESRSEPAFEVIAGVLHVFVCMHALE